MVEAHQPISEIERLSDWRLRFYYAHVIEYLELKAEAQRDAQKNHGGLDD